MTSNQVNKIKQAMSRSIQYTIFFSIHVYLPKCTPRFGYWLFISFFLISYPSTSSFIFWGREGYPVAIFPSCVACPYPISTLILDMLPGHLGWFVSYVCWSPPPLPWALYYNIQFPLCVYDLLPPTPVKGAQWPKSSLRSWSGPWGHEFQYHHRQKIY